MEDQQLVAVNGNGSERPSSVVVRQGFSQSEALSHVETAAAAVSAQARAETEARYVMALRRPRDWDDVRTKLLKECCRPGFAKSARYRKPIGKGVEGPSIRFAEAAMRCMGNIMPTVMVTYDDETKRVIRVSVTDLESNLTYGKDVVIGKTVERRELQRGQKALSSRTNSNGQTTYLVAATEDDLLNKENALISKALRTNGLRLLPGDILEECMEQAIETAKNQDAKDPDAARKQLADAFSALNINPSALKEYLGHDLGTCSPAKLVELRAVYAAIRDGEATWADVMEERRANLEAERRDAAPPPAGEQPSGPAPTSAKRGTASLKEKLGHQPVQGAAPATTAPAAAGTQAELPTGGAPREREPGSDG